MYKFKSVPTLNEYFWSSSIFLLFITSSNSPYACSTQEAGINNSDKQTYTQKSDQPLQRHSHNLFPLSTLQFFNSPACTAHSWWRPHITFPKPLLISSLWMLNNVVQLSPLHHTITFQALPNDKNIHMSEYLELRKQPYPKIPKTLDISTETWINTHGQFFYCHWKSSEISSRYTGIWQVADWSLPEVLTGTCESLPLWTQHVFM